MEKEYVRLTLFVGQSASLCTVNYTDEDWSKMKFKRFGVGPLRAVYNPWTSLIGGLKPEAPHIDLPYFDPFSGERKDFLLRVVFTDLEFKSGKYIAELAPGFRKMQVQLDSVRVERDHWQQRWSQADQLLRMMTGEERMFEHVKGWNDKIIKGLSRYDPALAQLIKNAGK